MLDWREILAVEEPGVRRRFGDMCAGVTLHRQGRSLIALMPDGGFRCLSTGFFNGGYTDSPQAVVNTTSLGGDVEWEMMGLPREVHDECTAMCIAKIGLDTSRTVGLGTAANMDNAYLVNGEADDGTPVSVVMTGGVRGNGGRAGDPAGFDEIERYHHREGTIVTIAVIDAVLSDSALLDAVSLATQAKSCILQELMARSLYSRGYATGSGTDQVVVVCRSGPSGTPVGSVRMDSDIGRELCLCVREALLGTFDLQSGMTAETQCDPFVTLSRLGVDMSRIRDEIRFGATMSSLLKAEGILRRDARLTAMTLLAAHLDDEVRNGCISTGDALSFVKDHIGGALLAGIRTDPVLDLRLERTEDIAHHMSLVTAILIQHTARGLMA